jgi:hypothetical protein
MESDFGQPKTHKNDESPYSITPLVTPLNQRSKHTRSYKLTHNPTKVNISGKISSQLCRADLRSISSSQGLEDTPRDTAKNLSSLKHWQVLGEERDEDESDNRNEGYDHCLSVAVPLANDTIDE